MHTTSGKTIRSVPSAVRLTSVPPNKNLTARISTQHMTAAATLGVARRSRTRCRSQMPRLNRSLSRNSTDSLLN